MNLEDFKEIIELACLDEEHACTIKSKFQETCSEL